MEVFDWLYFSNPSFLLLIPAVLLLYLVKRHNSNEETQLTQFIEPKLLSHLLTKKEGKTLPSWIGLLATCLLIIGIAGISWQKQPSKTFISPKQTILILDQSLSMYATDIKPNRQTRLKQKVRDLLDQIKEGNIAITAYAGDAYVISPFSQDKSTLTHFLLALDPLIMPLYGSDLAVAFKTSLSLIKNPAQKTQIILFTDDVQSAEINTIKNTVKEYNVEVDIIGVGTQKGSTITLPNGQLLQTQQGVVHVSLPEQKLNQLATELNGHYFDSALSDQDIQQILSRSMLDDSIFTESKNQSLQWREKGHWFAFPFLFWLLYQFRIGVLLTVLCFVLPQAPKSYASPLDWFTTPDQKAQKLADQGNWQEAQDVFDNPEWQAASKYALGDYETAASVLEDISNETRSAEFFYNKGNSLALSGKLENAIKAYEKAIIQKSNQGESFPQAKENLDYVKQQLKKQENEKKEQQNSNDSSSNGDEKDTSQGKSSEESNDSSSKEDEQQQNKDSQDQSKNQQGLNDRNTQESQQQEQPTTTEGELSEEDQIALDQWMRQIQDDPGGLLKRKLWYLHREKRAENSYRQQDGLPIW